MKIILILLFLFLQSCFIFKDDEEYKKYIFNKSSNHSENVKRITYNEINGVYYPADISQDEVLDYIEYFKKDESDSVHYRLGYITNRCNSSDKVQCDTLRFFVQKLIPYPVSLEKKVSIIDSTDIWSIVMEKVYHKTKNDSIVFEKNLEYDERLGIFFINSIVHKRPLLYHVLKL
jgi:hypothetical protein